MLVVCVCVCLLFGGVVLFASFRFWVMFWFESCLYCFGCLRLSVCLCVGVVVVCVSCCVLGVGLC